MSLSLRDIVEFLLTALAVAAVIRLLPLKGIRRLVVAALRLASLVFVLLALKGFSLPHAQERPRHIVYLVDHSASVDAAGTQWIARRLASLESIRPRQLSRTVLAFGEQAQVVVPTEHARLTDAESLEHALAASTVERRGTNLEGALLATLAAIPPHERGRVILLTDGRQTVGDVERILSHLHRFGLEVYSVPVAPAEPTGLVWEQLVVPPVAHKGSSVPIQLAFTNATKQSQPAEITVSLQGLPIARKRQLLRPGSQIASLAVPALTAGTMSVEVSVELPGASPPEHRKAYVEIEGPPRVLIVLDKPTELPLLATALKRREIEFAVATPQELPVDAGKLLDDDVVLLFQMPKSSLSEAQVAALRQYVERFGGGLIMVGLGGKLDDELTHQAPLDALLPVSFEPKGVQEAKRRVCVLMLIDRSGSMMGPRIAATKRAAVEMVKQMQPEDLVGVLAFDVAPYVVAEVQPARQVSEALIEKLVRLKSTGGTDILPALKAAQVRLAASGATVKHAILLSDGMTPFDPNAYKQMMNEFNRQHITLSTIGIGAAFVNTTLMDWMATSTGGTFYQMTNLDELPQLIARDTQKTLGQLPFAEGYFRPQRTPGSEWFGEIADWPALKGYLTTTAKPGARVELSIKQSETEQGPLLAHWQVGVGRVVVFASDADTRWSPEWIRWPRFENVWGEIVRQAMRPRPNEELFVWLDEQEGLPHVVIEGELTDPTAQLITSDGATTIPLALVQQSRFRWRAQVGHVDSGWYRLVVESHQPRPFAQRLSDGSDASQSDVNGSVSSPMTSEAKERGQGSATTLARRWLQIGNAQRNTEQPNLPPDEPLLRRIAQATQGFYDLPDRAFLPPTEQVQMPVPLRGWLLPLVVILLLVDVALRGRTML